MKNILSIPAKFLISIVLLLTSVTFSFAFTSETIENQKFDKTLADTASNIYVNPTQIYFTQVTTEVQSLQRNPGNWVKSIYYYSITRLKFSDIPYNYLIDENGIIYQGRNGGVGSNPELKNKEGAILIGYLSNNPVLTVRANQSIYQITEELSYKWGISKKATVKLSIEENNTKLSTLTATPVNGEFTDSINEALKKWKGYAEEHLEYKSKIEQVTYNKEVVIGSKLGVTVKFTNESDFPWFTDKNPIYISTSNGKNSTFAINGVWDSFSKPAHIENKVIKPGESAEIKFDLLAKITPGEASENFQIEKFDKKPFTGSSFNVKFSITKGNYTLVKTTSPQYGFVNIRECQWYSCKIIETVDEGVVFILLKEDNGWMKIQVDEDAIGWVMSKYLKKI